MLVYCPLDAGVKAAKESAPKAAKEKMAKKDSGLRIKTSADYDRAFKKAQEKKQPLVLKFYADWCGACTHYAPAFDEVAKSMKNNAVFATLNIDDADIKAIAQEFNVEMLPTTVIIKSSVGAKSAQQLSKEVAQASGE